MLLCIALIISASVYVGCMHADIREECMACKSAAACSRYHCLAATILLSSNHHALYTTFPYIKEEVREDL
jgi:hypothetical protein